MNKRERKSLAKAFTAAKEHLNKGDAEDSYIDKSDYICYAIEGAVRRDKISYYLRDQTRKIVQTRLNGYAVVEDYLRFKVRVPKKQMTKKNIQEFRHRWLDALIKEFSE